MIQPKTKIIIRYLSVLIFVLCAFLLTSKPSYAGWTDLNSAAGAGTTNLKGAGYGPSGQMIIVGDSGFIKTSTDGGASWTDRNTAAGAGTTGLKAASIGPSGEMLIGGDSGFIKTSTNGGGSWTDRNSAAGAGTTNIRAVSIGPTGIMLAVGDGGYVKQSTDGGASWSQTCSCASLFMLGAAVGPSNLMLAVATDEKFVSFNNGGSWSGTGTNASDLYAAAIGPSGQMIAGGLGNGYLQTSTDGTTWVDRTAAAGVQTTDAIRGLSIGSSGLTYAVGANGFIKSSTNGGVSWTDQNAAVGAGTTALRDVEIGASDAIILVGDAGFVKTYVSATAPSVTTSAASSVTATTAYLNSTINPNGSSTNVYYWYSTSPGGCSASYFYGNIGSGNSNVSPNSYGIGGLTPNTTYYFCAYGSNGVGSTSGSQLSFTTSVSTPTVASPTKTSIINSSATLGGNVTSDGGASVTGRGVCVGSSANPAIGGNCFSTTGTTGVFTVSATSLSQNTLYHYRAYATNSQGTSYSADDTFTTLGAPSVTTNAASTITGSTADLNSVINPNSSSTNVSYLWGTSNTSCSLLPNTLAGPSGLTGTGNISPNTTGLTGLTGSTTYYYCVMGTNAYGTTYGSVTNFTTSTSNPGSYTMMDAGSALGSGATDCDDNNAAPCPPTGVSASPASQTQMNVSWSAATGPAATSYDLIWCTGSSCIPSTTITGVTSTYAHTGRTCNTIYGYQIIAKNAAGSSSASNTAYGTTSSCASAPSATTSTATNVTATGVTLAGVFAQNGGTSNQYWFRYGTSNTGNCSTLSNASSASAFGSDGTWSLGITGLTSNTTYYYCAAASNSVGTTYATGISSFSTPVAWYLVDSGYALYTLNEMAMPSDNIPVMAFIGGGAKVAKCTDSSCTSSTVTTLSASANGGTGARIGIAIGTDGLPIVAYDTGAAVKVYHCSVANCTSGTTTQIYSCASCNLNPSIAVGSDGLPVISHNTGGTFAIYKCSNSACTAGTDHVLYSATTSGAYSKIAIVGGYPVAFFEDDTNLAIRYLRCTTLSCTAVASTTILRTYSSGVPVPGGSIRQASDGLPIIIYNGMNGSTVPSYTTYIKKCANIDCTSSSDYGGWTSTGTGYLDVPADTFPAAVIPTFNGANKLYYVKCATTSCSSYTTYSGPSGFSNYPQGASLETNSSSIPYLLYPSSGTPGNGTYILKCSSTTSCP